MQIRSTGGATIIVDAGTGLRSLGQTFVEQKNNPGGYHILLSHIHWDHIQGLPFFEPAYIPGTHISMYAMRAAADELHQVINGITRHAFFPVRLETAPATFAYHEVIPGQPFQVLDFRIMPIALNHPFGAVGYRIDADQTSVAYISDTAPFTEVLHKQHFLSGPEILTQEDRQTLQAMRTKLVDAITGTDTVIYDTHFSPEEYEKFPHFGHSTPEHALMVCRGINIKRLVLYHHAPSHTDDIMDEMTARYQQQGRQHQIEVVAAREGLTIPVGTQRAA